MRLLSKLSVLLILISPVVVGQPTAPAPVSVMPRQPMLTANAFILVDYDSGKVLAEQNSEQIVEPASLTKMMTMYIVDNEIKAGKLHLTDNIQISKRAWQAPGSRMFVQVDTGVKVEDLIRGIIIQSGNDSSMALAEHIAGSEQTFADLMNTYAQLLGMKNTHFKNATGLPDKEHVTTAKDMAILARAIIKNFPDTYQIYSQKEFIYNGIKQHNRNRLLWRNPAVDGIKTGFTDSAGYCLVASGKVNNMRLIAVIMGAHSEPARTEDANRLLMWGFKFFETNQIYQAGTKMQDIRVWGGSDKRLGIGFTDSVYITTPQGAFKKYTATTNLPASLKAPIKQGDTVGSYVIRDEQNQVIFEQPIVALQTIEKGNIYQRTRDYFKQSFRSVTSKFKS